MCESGLMVGDDVLESGAREDLSHLRGIKILVADLHPIIADVMTIILNSSGFSAFSAHNVSEAIRIASEKALDVAFLELLIGETDAIDAAERILAVQPYCRIVIWTGWIEPVLSWVYHEAKERFGGCDLIPKPIPPSRIIRIAQGEPVLYEPWAWLIGEDCLSGSRLHEYLREARDLVLKLMKEQSHSEGKR